MLEQLYAMDAEEEAIATWRRLLDRVEWATAKLQQLRRLALNVKQSYQEFRARQRARIATRSWARRVVEGIVKAFKKAWGFVKKAFSWLWGLVKAVFGWIWHNGAEVAARIFVQRQVDSLLA